MSDHKGGNIMKKLTIVAVVVLIGIGAGHVFAGGAKADALPDGMRGFSGVLVGTVVAKQDRAFTLDVARVGRLWRGNKAENAESAIGKKLSIKARCGKDGKPAAIHVRFIGTLKVGQKLCIEAKDSRKGLLILELNKEQRERGK